MYYENHMLEKECLPFIFHYNELKKFTVNEGNWHENPEFLYVAGGNGRIMYDGQRYEVSENSLVCVNSDSLHGVLTDDYINYYCLIVDEGFFRENNIPINTIMFNHVVSDVNVKEAFERIFYLYKGEDLYRGAKIRAEVLRLMIYLCENYRSDIQANSERSERTKQIITYMKSNYHKKIMVDDIVKKIGFSREYLSREFKKNTGISMIEYLNNLRCIQARKLLKEGKEPVSVIAERCGFENLSYFSKTYKRIMSKLPSEDSKNK